MSPQPLPNPYEHELPPEDLRIGRGAAWLVTGLFLLLIGLPPLLNDLREMGQEKPARWLPSERFLAAVSGEDHPRQSLPERLKSFESSLAEHLCFVPSLRRSAQLIMLKGLHAGNAKTVVGREGWLFYRPEIKALTGYGPLHEEPRSVASDPSVRDWQPPLVAIGKFAQQLKDRNVELWMVPVPMKESIYPEMLTNKSVNGPVTPPQQSQVSEELSRYGVRILWLDQLFWEMKKHDSEAGPVYLKQDTHWSPRAMEAAAAEIAKSLREKSGQEFSRTELTVQSRGDLAEKLNLPDHSNPYPLESATLHVVSAKSDPQSPIVLLGDSFVNIYDDPSLGFGEVPLSAGFAQHLMAASGRPVQVIAKNGGGATTVREQLAKLPDDLVRQKQVVVWVLAARDLFLSRSEAIANRVEWSDVMFNSQQSSPATAVQEGTIELEATVTGISEFPADHKTTPYASAVFCVRYRVERIIAGAKPADEIFVYHPLFQKREFLPAAAVKMGRRYRLIIQAWNDALPVFKQTLLDDFNALEPHYAESPTPLP